MKTHFQWLVYRLQVGKEFYGYNVFGKETFIKETKVHLQLECRFKSGMIFNLHQE